jgi:hypothetical protein
MDSGVPLAPSFTTTYPIMPTPFMGENPSVFHNGMHNYGTQSAPWVSSHSPIDMSSHFPSSVFPPYANTSFCSWGMMPPYIPSPFGGSHILQTPLTVGGWNIPSYESTMREVSAQICNIYTYYSLSTHPSSAMSVPTNTFPMADLRLSSGVSSEGSYFYSMGNPPHEVPSSGGNIYPHMSNPCHVAFSLQVTSLVLMPLQPFMNQYGGGYYLVGQGQGVNQDPSWPAISQNQSFPRPWFQMPQSTTATSPVNVCHTDIISPTSASHVRDWLTTSVSHVEDLQPIAASHTGGTCLVTASHISHTSPTSASHVGDPSPTSASHVGDLLLASVSHARSMSLATESYAGGIHMIEKPRRFRRKVIFLCRTCEGNHLTRLCPATAGILEAWFSLEAPSSSESSMVSPHSIPSLADTIVMPMQSSTDIPFRLGVDASFDLVVSYPIQPVVVSMKSLTDTSPMFEGDVSLDLVVSHLVQPMVMLMQSSTDKNPVFGADTPLDLVVSHPIQPMVEEVVISMQSSIDPTLLLESDKSKEAVVPMQFLVDPALLVLVLYLLCHVLSISSTSPFEQERVLLFLSSLSPSIDEGPFDWDGLVGYPMPFLGRDIIQYIIETITSVSTFPSSTWRALGLPKLVSILHKILTFHRRSAREPWPPP